MHRLKSRQLPGPAPLTATPTALSALLFLALLIPGLLQIACNDGGDDWVDPTGDDDDPDDDDDTAPWSTKATPGAYLGSSTGLASFTGPGQYSCEGVVTLDLDEDLRATGEVDCVFPHNGESCNLTFEDLELDVGPQNLEIDCYGPGVGSLSTWTGNATAVGGRWYRGGEAVSVEFSWYATKDEEI
jgi:hypothetical protein